MGVNTTLHCIIVYPVIDYLLLIFTNQGDSSVIQGCKGLVSIITLLTHQVY